jgi:hypothetical protein
VSNYKKLDKYLEKKGLKVKEKTKLDKGFKTLSTKEKDALLERIAKDLGYIDG